MALFFDFWFIASQFVCYFFSLIAGLVQELTINIDLGDLQIAEDDQKSLSFHLPLNLHFLKVNNCVLSSHQGKISTRKQ